MTANLLTTDADSLQTTTVEVSEALSALPSQVEKMLTHTPLAIERLEIQSFKQFTSLDIRLDSGVSLLAGGNNSGKSTLLHALAVWEFCRLATIMERGPAGLLPTFLKKQGFGIGDDEFSPINIPTLKHLWTNLKPSHGAVLGDKGYTLKITCTWKIDSGPRRLGFALALANDRLFIKLLESNLQGNEPTPRAAYLPPFAGIKAREERLNGAVRRRRIGEGLSGAILRNLLLDLHQRNQTGKRELLLAARNLKPHVKRPRVEPATMAVFQASDPWEQLQTILREVFRCELEVSDFQEEYHSYIQVFVKSGFLNQGKFMLTKDVSPRDLMVEGSGFLQWLSVLALALSTDVDVLLLDEPDAHLHPHLETELVSRLDKLALSQSKQILMATHSAEILKRSPATAIIAFASGKSPKYLVEDIQKRGLLAGIGSSYLPVVDKVRETKKVFFYEGPTDLKALRILASRLDTPLHASWVPWKSTEDHSPRSAVWDVLKSEIPSLQAISLRDRDEVALATIDIDLTNKGFAQKEGFQAKNWKRRYIESYFVIPSAVSYASGMEQSEVERILDDEFAFRYRFSYVNHAVPTPVLDLRGKEILKRFGVDVVKVAKSVPLELIPADVRLMIDLLAS